MADYATAARGRRPLERQPFQGVVSDLLIPGQSGLHLLRSVKADYPEPPEILLTAYGSVESAVEAMKCGALDYLTKPAEQTDLLMTVARALETQQLREEVKRLRSSVSAKYGSENIIGQSPNLLSVPDVAGRAAQSDVTVLINGETGTGKELLAKAIHFNSPRRERPFVAINCGAIPRELLESELFGHLKRSFTGAIAHKKGRVETADGGTLFLDEIGEMPAELQVKLLRVIQEREIEKLGSTEPMRVAVRVVAATHRNLAVIPVELPPLRERACDIPDLVNFFFDRGSSCRLG